MTDCQYTADCRLMGRYEILISWLVQRLDQHRERLSERAWDKHYRKHPRATA